MKKFKILFIVILTASLISAGVMALTNPDIPRYHMGAGGESTGGGYTLKGSIGQHEAGVALSGGGYKLAGGFWVAWGEIFYDIFIPFVMK